MTPRSLFIIILRIIGVYVLVNLFSAVPPVTAAWVMGGGFGGLQLVFITLLSILAILAVCYALIFRADSIIDRFALDQGFPETEIYVSLNEKACVLIALFLVGGLVLINEVPNLMQQVYAVIDPVPYSMMGEAEISWRPVLLPLVKIILALLIIGERRRIAAYFLRDKSSTAGDTTTTPDA